MQRAFNDTGQLLRAVVVAALIALVAPLALASPAQAAIDPAAVYRAVNLNGAAVTVGGVAFENGTTASNLTSGPSRFCNQNVALSPAADTATATMIRCSVYGSGTPGARVTMTAIPSGTYKVSLYNWEDNNSATFALALNGTTVQSGIVSGTAGTWKVLGPYTVNITGGSLAITSAGGTANLSGLVLERATATPGNRAPTVTSPGNQTSTRGTAIAPLRIAATDPDAGQTVSFSATGLPAGLSIASSTGVISGTPTTVGTSNVTIRATDNGTPALSGSASFAWTISDAPTGGTLYRAVNLNGTAVTADGINFQAGTTAPNLTSGPSRFCNQNVTLSPGTDAAKATMIRCSVYGTSTSGGAKVTMTGVPAATYNVSVYTWEDNSSTTFSLALNGTTVASNVVSGSAGTWKLLGPYPVTVTSAGTIALTSSGGAANISGLVVRSGGVIPGGGGGTFDRTKVTDTFVAGGSWTSSLAADWLGNGHMVVLTQKGLVYDVDPATGTQRQILDIRSKVNSGGEAGALDILTDQAGTGFYVYYSVLNSDRLRISHFTAGSSTERVIWNNPGLGYNTASPFHVGGSLNIGPDGKLYLSIGDRNQARSQDRTNVFGKILRMNLDGTVPADNPLRDGAGPNVDEIWAYGLRNPYRASFDRSTGLYWIGDVGGNVDTNAYEEVDIGRAGANYGWPACEGPLGAPKNGPVCPAGVTAPVWSYEHTTGAGCCQNKAIVGGEVYRGSMFPLAGHYLYSDYASDEFFWLRLGADGRTGVASGLVFQKSAATPVWLSVGPDGAIYWLGLGPTGNGQLRKLTYSGSTNRPPVISTASATPTTGTPPLEVRFMGAASDPDGTAVTYQWDFGDGMSEMTASPTHTYSTAGKYQATLRVTSNGASTSSNPISITVGSPPTATITAPPDGTKFSAGQTLTFTGTGSDPGVGPLPASALSWNIEFLHNEHSHPGKSGTGASISFPIPTSGHDYAGDTRYRVTLTARDADGLTGTSAITVSPNKRIVPVRSDAATTMTVDSVTHNLPFDIDTLKGFQHTISVPASVCVSGTTRQFSSWSDGGPRTHTITVPETPSLLIARYTSTGTACTAGGATAPLVAPLTEESARTPTPSATPTPTATPTRTPTPAPTAVPE